MAIIRFTTIFLLLGVFAAVWAIRIPRGFSRLSHPDRTQDTYYFIISNILIDWYSAAQICESIGTFRFVSLESDDKSRQLYLKLNSSGIGDAWTSGNDVLHNGEYVWAGRDNEPFGPEQGWRTKYENGTARPPNNPVRHCVSVTSLVGECGPSCEGIWGWDEEDCPLFKRVVCEPKEIC